MTAIEQERTAFMQAIIAEPAADVHRLVFADWLEEHGDGELAEFIRLQCRIAAIEATCSCGHCVRLRGGGQHTNGPCAVDQERNELPDGRSKQAFLRKRERELLSAHGGEWVKLPWSDWAIGLLENGPSSQRKWSTVSVALSSSNAHLTFRRGFVAEVQCTLADWTQHGPDIVRSQPVEVVRLTDRKAMVNNEYECYWGTLLDELDVPNTIPESVFRLMCPKPSLSIGYPTEANANAALSAAMLTWARQATIQ